MASKPFTNEELNFFKFCKLVLHEFPTVIRRIFIDMWNTKVAAVRPTLFIDWDDSTQVRNMLLASEGGKTHIPTSKSIEEWDCTALFQATIYAKTFGSPSSKGSTLDDLYLKKVKPSPGSFHSSVQSSTGNQEETYALTIDQLRLLRNKLCHLPKSEIIKADFDNYVLLVKDALSAVNIDTAFVDDIGQMDENDFPTEKVKELEECRMKELQAISMFHEKLEHQISSVDGKVDFIGGKVDSINGKVDSIDVKVDSIGRRMGGIHLETNVPDLPPSSVTHDVCSRQFTTSELTRIAKRICSVWPSVARLTGKFQSHDIDNISLNTSFHDPTEKATQMLHSFKSRLGKREDLANAIEESGNPAVAAKVRSGHYIDHSD